jgi:nucleoside-diphosphate-sugar epimerase
MKVAVTGHTAGIGKAISQWMVSQGHTVVGFSRTTGFDISNDAVLDKIVELCYDVDVFVNNAQHDFQQTKLLYMLQEKWQNQQRTIINIGSNRTQSWNHSHFSRPTYPRHYHTAKLSMDEACRLLWSLGPWPRIMLVKPCGTQTPGQADYSNPNHVSAEDMADLICSAWAESRCRIQEISFERNPEK